MAKPRQGAVHPKGCSESSCSGPAGRILEIQTAGFLPSGCVNLPKPVWWALYSQDPTFVLPYIAITKLWPSGNNDVALGNSLPLGNIRGGRTNDNDEEYDYVDKAKLYQDSSGF